MATSGVHHLGLTVSDLAQTTAFFTDCLGWKVVREVPSYPAKFVSDGTVLFTLWQSDKKPTPFNRKTNIGLHHVAIRVGDKEQLVALYEKVRGYPGTTIEFGPQPIGDGPSMHCIFREPGGIRMELAWSPPS